jgi:hypothetical protein
LEQNREVYFTKKEIIKKSSVYFSSEFDNFTKIVLNSIERSTTKKPVKLVFLNFQSVTSDNLSRPFLHLICSILAKVDDITLTNCRIQIRNLIEKNYLLFAAKKNEFVDVNIKISGWYQLSSGKHDIYLEILNKYLLQKSFKNKNYERFIRRFFNRKIFKSIIMCYFHNETHFGVVKKLEAFGFESGKTSPINEEVSLIRDFLKKEFEDFEILSLIINYGVNSSIINQKAISLYKVNVETFQYHALQEVIQVDH